jgi:hypothetical protein
MPKWNAGEGLVPKKGRGRPRKGERKPVVVGEDESASLREYVLDSILSFKKFASRLLRIQTKTAELVPFCFNSIQDLLEMVVVDLKERGKLIRMVILKARREGVSTWISARFFWKTATNKNRYAWVVTHEPEATDFVFSMHKRFLNHLPEFMKPDEKYNNKKMLEFNNDKGTGLDSAVRVGTAGKEDLGSAQLIHFLHLSEVAKWPRNTAGPLFTSMLQCVPEFEDTEIYIESTAKGIGGEFYTRYWASGLRYVFYLEDGEVKFRVEQNRDADPNNEYVSVFIPWFVFPEYTRPLGDGDGLELTKDEELLRARHGLTMEQVNWRRWCIANKCNGKVDTFNQEYPSTPDDAFLSKSNNVFDVQELFSLSQKAVPCLARYSINKITGVCSYDPKGILEVWQEPLPMRTYVVSGDPAEGLVVGDASSLDVIDVLTGKQVCHLRGTVPPDLFGLYCLFIARRYNDAHIAIERNNHGLTVLQIILDAGYTNIYAETLIEPPHRPRKRYGWLTTKKSKYQIIDNLDRELRENTHGLNSKETIEEMLSFKQFEDGAMEAEEGRNDDRVMSFAIGKYVARLLRKTVVSGVVLHQPGEQVFRSLTARQKAPLITSETWN